MRPNSKRPKPVNAHSAAPITSIANSTPVRMPVSQRNGRDVVARGDFESAGVIDPNLTPDLVRKLNGCPVNLGNGVVLHGASRARAAASLCSPCFPVVGIGCRLFQPIYAFTGQVEF